MKPLLNIVGALALVLAVLGIFLPLLPTTPFLLLASACFARGSTRLHRWLLSHPVLGTYISNFERGNGIPLRAKVVATALLWASLTYSLLRFENLALRLALVATGAGVSVYLWLYLPTLHERKARSSDS